MPNAFHPICRSMHAPNRGEDLWVSQEKFTNYSTAAEAAAKEHNADKARGGSNWVRGMYCVADENGNILTPTGDHYDGDPRASLAVKPPFKVPEQPGTTPPPAPVVVPPVTPQK